MSGAPGTSIHGGNTMQARTLLDKLWQRHLVSEAADDIALTLNAMANIRR
jgi:hypothetical protein